MEAQSHQGRMSTPALRRTVAGLLIAAVASLVPMPARSGASASWSGRVFGADRGTPRQSVVVGLLDGRGEWAARSQPTRADGSFSLAAEAGSYRLAVETPEGLFVFPASLDLAAGVNAPGAVSLLPAPRYAEQQDGFGNAGSRLSPTVKWIIAGSIGLAALFALAEASADENEPAASPN